MQTLAKGFSEVARGYGLPLFTCAEETDLSGCGIEHGACIDGGKIAEITGCAVAFPKDRNQRSACNCVESVDIGVYDTCPRGCAYCYATTSAVTVDRRRAAHDPASPMLAGRLTGDETIVDREAKGRRTQLKLW